MPFGTEITTEGVLFRLLATDAEKINLVLEGGKGDSNFCPWLVRMAGIGCWPLRLLPARSIVSASLAPDPVSHRQAEDIHRHRVVIDPLAFSWQDIFWQGRP